MTIDGKYDIQLQTMFGTQVMELNLISSNNVISGNIDGHFGKQSFTGGKLEGDNISLSMKLQSPMGEMKLNVTATVENDTIFGEVQLGSFRPTPFSGKKA